MIRTDDHGTWATIPEAAHHQDVTTQLIYRWTYRKNIRRTRLDGRIHVNLDDINAYLAQRGVQSHASR